MGTCASLAMPHVTCEALKTASISSAPLSRRESPGRAIRRSAFGVERLEPSKGFQLTWSPATRTDGWPARRAPSEGRTIRASVDSTVSEASAPSQLLRGDSFYSRLPEYSWSDFSIAQHVSIGLSGRSDELLYEGMVTKPTSLLQGSRVVLRMLTGKRAVRWGERALQVLPRLAKERDNWRHPYTVQVHGVIRSSRSADCNLGEPALTLIHGYYGRLSLQQWLLSQDWLPALESRLALGKEAARRIGDERTGGDAVSRQLRVVRVVLRDVLIAVNYVHSRGMAHLDLRLQNLQISAHDRHVKVGLLGKTVDFPGGLNGDSSTRRNMIAYDVRCIGIIMARLVLRELNDQDNLVLFRSFLQQGHDPTSLREFVRPMLRKESFWGTGMKLLDKGGGAGWHLLSSLLSTNVEDRISCPNALRHPFLCGPRWKVEQSVQFMQWGLGSAAVRIVEEFVYLPHQRRRLLQLIEALELMDTITQPADWGKMVPGRWRYLYQTGRQIGLTSRQASPAVRIQDLYATFNRLGDGLDAQVGLSLEVTFIVMPEHGDWPLDKSGCKGSLTICCKQVSARPGDLLTQKGMESAPGVDHWAHGAEEPDWHRHGLLRLQVQDVGMNMRLDYRGSDATLPQRVVREVRLQIPRELFDVSGLVCCTHLSGRLMVLRSASGAALLLTRSCTIA
eukprot:SM000116S24196  [mRNA]  locus=s116:29813:34415:+ [translate_table: standard]